MVLQPLFMSGGFTVSSPSEQPSSALTVHVSHRNSSACPSIIWVMGGKVSTYFSPTELVYFHGLCVLSSLMEKMLYGSLQFFPWATAHITGSHKRQEAEYGKGMGSLVDGGDCGDGQQLCIILNMPRNTHTEED